MDVRAQNVDQNTPLHYFCEKFSSPNCKEPLTKFLELGADVNAVNRFKETPLHKACFNNSLRIMLITLLIEAGSEVNKCNANGEGPLHFAVRLNRKDLVHVLIQAGADIYITNKDGRTPLDIAASGKAEKIVEHLKKVDELYKWLKSLDPEIFQLYHKKFVAANIFLDNLATLEAPALETIGITHIAHSIKILHAKQFLEQTTASTTPGHRLRESFSVGDATTKRSDSINGSVDLSMWVIESRDLEFTGGVSKETQEITNDSAGLIYKGIYKGSTVAIKFITVSSQTEEEEFRKEFETLCVRSHPNLVKFHGACFEPKLCTVMDYCSRGSLYEVLNHPTYHIGWGKVFRFAVQMARAVLYLHSLSPEIIHGGIQSKNILVTSSWILKLSNFDLGRTTRKSEDGTKVADPLRYIYFSPELAVQVEGGKDVVGYTTKSDVFSMGIVLLEMIRRCTDGKYTIPWYSDFGVLPEADFVILMDVGKGLRPTLNGVPLNAPSPNSVPIPLAQLYQDCVAQDKEDRPTSKQILSRILQMRLDFETYRDQWFLFQANQEAIKPELKQ